MARSLKKGSFIDKHLHDKVVAMNASEREAGRSRPGRGARP